MMKAPVIALDFETSRKGLPSVEFYRPDFRADSVAVAWRENGEIKSYYCTGEAKIQKLLQRVAELKIPVIAHNAQFEYAVTKYRFPGLEKIFKIDTMRLLQVADNGHGSPSGFKLESGAARWLPVKYHDHKQRFYELIRERGKVKKGQEGANLHLLTDEELSEYNTADAVVTLLLYETLTDYFETINYDWTIDHELFFANLPFNVEAEGRGVLVDRAKAQQAVGEFTDQFNKLEHDFFEINRDAIAAVESRLRAIKLGKYKTERGRLQASLDDCVFSIGSSKHLKMLFCDVLGMQPKFFTEKGAPTFGAKLLWQFGERGLMLDKKGRLQIQTKQAQALLDNSEEDGRWHLRIKMVGTGTDRYAGGGHGDD